jgi:hypothetical protein
MDFFQSINDPRISELNLDQCKSIKEIINVLPNAEVHQLISDTYSSNLEKALISIGVNESLITAIIDNKYNSAIMISPLGDMFTITAVFIEKKTSWFRSFYEIEYLNAVFKIEISF